MKYRCKTCDEDKLEVDFSRRTGKNGKPRRDIHCKSCVNQRMRTWYAKNHPREREKNRQRMQEWRGKHPDHYYRYNKNFKLQQKFGISLEEYEELLGQQNGCCAICGRKEGWKGPGGERATLHVDHCHETGDIRGLLCSECNLGLSHFHDDPNLMDRAGTYLRRYAQSRILRTA